MRSPVKVALLGYGTVGRSVVRILDECTDEAKLTRILMRSGFNPKDQRMTDSFESILDDHSIEVVVECMGGLEPAHEYIVRALMSGKHVVTSNNLFFRVCFRWREVRKHASY